MRTSGVLMPISSLPSPYGIGTMGKSARKFVDFLVKGGQTYWQILPICPTSYGDSPYQSFSSFAGNPYFIDLDILCKENLLKKKECESFDWGTSEEYIDYGTMYVSRYALLHKAYARFVKNMPEDFSAFCETEKDWLEDYTLFMALKDANDGKAWGSGMRNFVCVTQRHWMRQEKSTQKILSFIRCFSICSLNSGES